MTYLIALLIASEIYIQRLINNVLDEELNFKWLEEQEQITRRHSISNKEGSSGGDAVLDEDHRDDEDIEAGVGVDDMSDPPLDFFMRRQSFSKDIHPGFLSSRQSGASYPVTTVYEDSDEDIDDGVQVRFSDFGNDKMDEIDDKIKALADCTTDLNELPDIDRKRVVLRLADAFKEGSLTAGSVLSKSSTGSQIDQRQENKSFRLKKFKKIVWSEQIDESSINESNVQVNGQVDGGSPTRRLDEESNLLRRLSSTYIASHLKRDNNNNSYYNTHVCSSGFVNSHPPRHAVEDSTVSTTPPTSNTITTTTTTLTGSLKDERSSENQAFRPSTTRSNRDDNDHNKSLFTLKHSDNKRFLYFHCLYRMMQMESLFYAEEARHMLQTSELSSPPSSLSSPPSRSTKTTDLRLNPMLKSSKSIRFLTRSRSISQISLNGDTVEPQQLDTDVVSNYQVMKLITKERKERDSVKQGVHSINPEINRQSRSFSIKLERKDVDELHVGSSRGNTSLYNCIYNSVVRVCSCLYKIPGHLVIVLLGHHSGLHSLSLAAADDDACSLKLHAELSEIFLFCRPELYFYAIEIALLIQCLYIALWATNFLFIANMSYNLILWNIALLLPLPINIFILQHVIFTSCMLKSIVCLDKEIAADIYESTEKERDIKYKLRKLVRNSLQILYPEDNMNWSKYTEIAFKKFSRHNRHGLNKDDFINFLHYFQIILRDKSVELIYKALDADKDRIIHWHAFKAIIFPELHSTADVKVNRTIHNAIDNRSSSVISSSNNVRPDQHTGSSTTANINLEYHIAQTIRLDNDEVTHNDQTNTADQSIFLGYGKKKLSSSSLLSGVISRGLSYKSVITYDDDKVDCKMNIDHNGSSTDSGSKDNHGVTSSSVAVNKIIDSMDLSLDSIYMTSVEEENGSYNRSKSSNY